MYRDIINYVQTGQMRDKWTGCKLLPGENIPEFIASLMVFGVNHENQLKEYGESGYCTKIKKITEIINDNCTKD